MANAPAAAPASAAKAAASDADAFALDLYAQLMGDEGNLFFSPYSIDAALAMTYAGARGNTAAQMAKVLHFSLPPDELSAAMGQLASDLNHGGEVRGKPAYELAIANALWGQKGYAYQPSYLQVLARDYQTQLHEANFAADPEAARRDINAWVKKQTKDKIADLFGPGTIDQRTALVLANAIYFKGNWSSPFEKTRTQEQSFHAAAGKTVPTPLMHQQHKFGYMESAELQAVELPYAGERLSMVVLLPRTPDGLPALEKTLTAQKLQEWLASLRSREVQLDLPRFKMEQPMELAAVLKRMGMTDAFNPAAADFSGIATAERLMIDKVMHKAFVDVNEEGTEAAAATGITMRPTAVRIEEPPAVFRADHPFLFLIRDRNSSAILFLGRLVDPK